MCDAHTNFAYATVETPPSPAVSGLSLIVAAGLGALFPAVPFNATVWPAGVAPLNTNAEIIRVTGIAGDTFTIERAQEGTAAVAIAAGYQIAATITAKTLTDLETTRAGINGAITGGSLTVNTSGVSINLPAYLTTAQPVGAYLTTAALSQDSSKYAGTNGAITGGSITVNTDGVSVNLPAYLTTAQPPGAYLTTAMQSASSSVFAKTGFTTTTSAGAVIAGTHNTDGLLLAVPAFLTTAQAPGAYLTTAMASNRGSDFVQATAAFAGTNASGTIASGGISVSVDAGGGGLTNIKVSAGTLSQLRSAVTFGDSNGVSFGLETNGIVTATVATNYQSQGAYLTTAALSGDTTKYAGVGETVGTIAGTDLAMTVNTAGVSIGYPKWITTAALSDHSHGNPTLALTNLSGTTASASNGLTLSLSAAAPGGAGPTQSYYLWPDEIQNSSAWQVSGSTSHIQPVYLPFALSASYLRFPLTLSCIGSMASIATAANVTRGMTISSTINVGFYTQGTGASSRSLFSYATGSATWVQQARYSAGTAGSQWSSGHTLSFPREGGNTAFTSSAQTSLTNVTINSTQLSDFTNLRYMDVPFATSLAAGVYWFLYGSSTSGSSSGTANVSTLRILASNFVATQVNQAVNLMGSATNSSNQFRQGLGSWTTNTIGTVVTALALANISTSASHPILPFQIIRQA